MVGTFEKAINRSSRSTSERSRTLRSYKVAAENIFVFMHTSTFNNDPFYSDGASARFAETTNDTGEVVALAVRTALARWLSLLEVRRDDYEADARNDPAACPMGRAGP